jgi:hypothetical protein
MLLCDLHIHTTYSDGALPLPKVVDLFGRAGHDVIAITDHIVNRDNTLGRIAHAAGRSLTPESWKRYSAHLHDEADRAWRTYGMLVIPGAELTRNTANRDTSVHVLALGLDDFLPADGDPLDILREIRRRGAVSVACHPHETIEFLSNTWYLWNRRPALGDLVDLWEVANRWEIFPVVSRETLPYCANSDFHRPEHLWAWKTLVAADRNVPAVLEALRRGSGIGIQRLWKDAAAASA